MCLTPVNIYGGIFHMTENFSSFSCQDNQFKESVCIDAYRVYDSCADKDCLENLRVNFSETAQHVIDQATSVRAKNVNVITTYIDLEAIPFRKGYYSVDMTFFFEVELEAFVAPTVMPASVSGLCVFNKKVVLYGSEGNVRIFTSGYVANDTDIQNMSFRNLPKATVQVADPVALSARFCDPRDCSRQPQCRVPECICRRFGGEFVRSNNVSKTVAVTLGLFTIVQIERNVQMRIPAYDFCIPKKECVTSTDNPCDLFSRIEFPTEEFFPPRTLEDPPCSHSKSCCSGETV